MSQFILCWGSKVSDAFARRVIQAGEDFNLDPNWLMACMGFESAGTFSSSVQNPHSSATGLIQFMESTAKHYGVTTNHLSMLTPTAQFDYVWLYFRDAIRDHGPLKSLADCYMAILYPRAIGQPDGYPLFIQGTSSYAVNVGLDTNKDHTVSKAEAASHVAEVLVDGLRPGHFAVIQVSPPNQVQPLPAPSPQPKETALSFLSKFVFNPILAEIARGFASSNPVSQAVANAASGPATSTALVVGDNSLPPTGSPNSPMGQTNPMIQQLEDDLNAAVAQFVATTVSAEVPVVGMLVAPKAAELTKMALQFAENHALSYVAGLFHFHINTQPVPVPAQQGVSGGGSGTAPSSPPAQA